MYVWSDMKKTVSVIIPAYNEEDCIQELESRLNTIIKLEDNYDWEIFIIENGSTDCTWEKLKVISQNNKTFKVIKLSRNFRMDGGLTAGLEFVTGDACVLMTADLQDPPEMISVFLRKWEEGYENIYGVVEKRIGTNILRRINSKLFYLFANKLSGNAIPENASDFRLVDKKVYLAVKGMTEKNRFIRGLFAWAGFKSIGIPMERPPRYAGVSNASTGKVIDLALKGIFSHSYKPLRLISLIGFIVSLIAIISLVPLTWFWLVAGVPFAGFGSMAALIIGSFGFQALMMGVMSEYIALIYEESKNRPNFIVSETLGIDS
jgi:glycosyltransferase involved in cell wall biosynthesis